MNIKVKKLTKDILFFLKQNRNILFNLYLCNFFLLVNKKITIGKKCNFTQKTRFTGTGSLKIGNNVNFGFKLGGHFRTGEIEIQARISNSLIEIGDSCSTNNNLLIISCGSIKIGKNCLIGENVTIMDFEAHGITPDKRNSIGEIGSVDIKENVWIGNNVTILKNVTIGKNSIIGAGSIVTKNIPDNVIAVGAPCKVIKEII